MQDRRLPQNNIEPLSFTLFCPILAIRNNLVVVQSFLATIKHKRRVISDDSENSETPLDQLSSWRHSEPSVRRAEPL